MYKSAVLRVGARVHLHHRRVRAVRRQPALWRQRASAGGVGIRRPLHGVAAAGDAARVISGRQGHHSNFMPSFFAHINSNLQWQNFYAFPTSDKNF